MTTLEFAEERLTLFPTNVTRRCYAGLSGVNARLRELVLEKEASQPGLQRSNVGSFHSEADFLTLSDPAIVVFRSLLQAAVHDHVARETGRAAESFQLRLRLDAWANVSRSGGFARPHVHPSASYAVVYYVDVGDDVEAVEGRPTSGVLELLDPRNRPHMFQTPGIDQSDTVGFKPRNAEFIIFPAHVYHLVLPYRGERPRISIACNVVVEELMVQTGAEGAKP